MNKIIVILVGAALSTAALTGCAQTDSPERGVGHSDPQPGRALGNPDH